MRANILFVDDDQMLCSLCQRYLSRCGFDVMTACGGEAALRKAAGQPFDVAIVDLTMPGQDGLDLIQELKMQNPSATFVLTSAIDRESLAETVRQHAAVDLMLSKPWDLSTLDAVLGAAVARRSDRARRLAA